MNNTNKIMLQTMTLAPNEKKSGNSGKWLTVIISVGLGLQETEVFRNTGNFKIMNIHYT